MSLLQESDQFNYKTIDDCCYNNYKICCKKRKTEKVRIKVKASVVGKFTHSQPLRQHLVVIVYVCIIHCTNAHFCT